jgi:DNA-binding SARP family transcriptional activator
MPLQLTAQRLVAFLAVHSQPLHRAYVAGQLWFATSDRRAYASLRSAICRVRQSGLELVEANRSHVWLASDVVVDVREQVALAHWLLDPSAEFRYDDYVRVLEGELLPDWYDEWVMLERERLRHLRLHALDALAEKLTACSRYGEAIEAALAALQADAVRESAYRALIRACLAEGNRGEAIRQFRRYRDALRRRFGLEPSNELRNLVESFAAVD